MSIGSGRIPITIPPTRPEWRGTWTGRCGARTASYIVDGNLTSVEYADRLPSITVPTLITVGDHDQVAPSISEDMHKAVKGSTLRVIPESGHMTFVDQPTLYVKVVTDFLTAR